MKDIWSAILRYAGMLSKRKVFCGPHFLILTLPSTCNHRCVFCLTGGLKDKENDSLSFKEIQSVVKEAYELKIKELILNSVGETLLYPRIKELIAYIYKLTQGKMKLKIVTNGTNLEFLGNDFIEKHGIDLWVSLHGGDFETWQTTHRPNGDAFNQYTNLKKTLALLQSNKKICISIHVVVYSGNYNKLDSLIGFCRDTGIKRVNFQFVRNNLSLSLNNEQKKYFLKIAPTLNKDFQHYGIRNNLRTLMKVFSRDGYIEAFYKSNMCFLGWLLCVVWHNGNIVGCCAGKKIANIRQQSLKEVWRIWLKDFRNEGVKTRGLVSGCDCNNCPHLDMNIIANKLTRPLGYFLNQFSYVF